MAYQDTQQLFTVVEATNAAKVPFAAGQYIIQPDGIVYYDPTTATSVAGRVKLTPDVGGKVSVFTVAEGAADTTSLATVTNPIQGDMAICKHLIAGTTDKYSYTAYVYSGTQWEAMDGNYTADTVFLTEDILMAGQYSQVGNLTKSQSGTGTFSVQGKSVAEALRTIFTKTLQPADPTQPAVSITFNAGNFEVGTKVTPTYTASLSAGSYTYGPATGVTASAWSVVNNQTGDDQQTLTTASGSFKEIEIKDATNYTVTATATHNEGAIAKDNIGGNSNPIKRIAAGTKSKTSGKITGYRKPFWGYKSTSVAIDSLDSAAIRALGNSGNSVGALPTSFTVPEGSTQVIFAAKAGTKSTLSATDANALNAPVAFTKYASKVSVKGLTATSDAVAYDLWVATYDGPTGAVQSLRLVWA